MQFVEVPDLKNGRLALSGIVMTAATVKSDANTQEDIDGTPAVRIFKAGSAISYAYEILNARADGNAESQLETQIRLYRDGQAIYRFPYHRSTLTDSRKRSVMWWAAGWS